VSRIDVTVAELRGRGLARSRFNSIWNPLVNDGLSKFTKVHRGNHLFGQLVIRLGVFSAVNNGVVATSFSIG